MKTQYEPGTFCIEIRCERHKAFASLSGDEYLKEKRKHCEDCLAWQFFCWLGEHKWRIFRGLPEIPPKELAARLKGMDPRRAEHLSEEEILCL